MKFMAYTAPDGTETTCHPIPNARLVKFDGKVMPLFVLDRRGDAPLPEGAEWAETADEFLDRIAKKDVPADATNIRIVEG